MVISEESLKTFLIDAGVVTSADISRAVEMSKEKRTPFTDILVSENKISETDLRRAQAYVLGVPFVSLIDEKIEADVLSLIPEPIARNHNVVAYKKTSTTIEVAMLDINDISTIDFLKKKLEQKILPRLTDVPSIKHALTLYKKSLRAEFDDIIQKETISIKATALENNKEPASEAELKQLAEDLPIVKIVDTLISHAILQEASDIHIEPLEESLVVRYRIDGILRDAMVLPKDSASGIVARIKVLSNLKLDEKRLPQDGRFKISNDDQKVSFRVSTIPTYFGEKTVIRILRENAKGFSLEKLGFHGDALERIHEAMKLHTGMILASGPTGSGKTTTLYTMLDMLNTPDVNISTVEDPIEYQMARINQTQVRSDIGMTFSNGLRALLRQDPNIIMVGEIRDGETASLAINAALTGHLVLSTIHTNSAAGAIPRFIDMGAEPFLLVSTLKTVIAQRLVRRLSDSKEKYFMNENELKALGKIVDLDRMMKVLKDENVIAPDAEWKDVPFYKPMKSADTEDGYRGRVGIHEVLKVTPTIKDLIISGASADAIEIQAKKEGMTTMLEDGIFLAVQGYTTTEEVLRVVSE